MCCVWRVGGGGYPIHHRLTQYNLYISTPRQKYQRKYQQQQKYTSEETLECLVGTRKRPMLRDKKVGGDM